jgi:hypothetical protein
MAELTGTQARWRQDRAILEARGGWARVQEEDKSWHLEADQGQTLTKRLTRDGAAGLVHSGNLAVRCHRDCSWWQTCAHPFQAHISSGQLES